MERTSKFEWLDVNQVPISPEAKKHMNNMDPLACPSIKTEPIDEIEDNHFSEVTIKREIEDGSDFLMNITDMLKGHIHPSTCSKGESSQDIVISSTDLHKCKKCSKQFVSRLELLRHNKKQHTRQFTCSTCNKSWSNILLLNAHLRKSHRNIKNFFIRIVIETKNQSNNYKFDCKYCTESFSKLSELQFHSLYSHKKPKFVCIKCNKSWPRKHMFDLHVFKEHCDSKLPVKVEYGDKKVRSIKSEMNSNIKSVDMNNYNKIFKLKPCYIKVDRLNTKLTFHSHNHLH